MSPIKDYYHYVRLLSVTGEKDVPNHVIPELAPVCTFASCSSGGRLRNSPCFSNHMLALVLREQFRICEVVIRAEPLDSKLFSALKQYMPTQGEVVVFIDRRTINRAGFVQTERNGFVQIEFSD